MKDFVRPAGRLRTLPFPARLTYSVFLAFTLIALAESAWLGADMLGADLRGLRAYYAGDSAPSPPAAAAASDGPALELPDDMVDAPDSERMPLRKLLEVSHFHLFSMPVYLMILAHLFMLSRWSSRAKSLWIGLGSLGVAAHLVAPWLAQTGVTGASAFYAGSGTLLLASWLVMGGVPLYEMWLAKPDVR